MSKTQRYDTDWLIYEQGSMLQIENDFPNAYIDNVIFNFSTRLMLGKLFKKLISGQTSK